MSEDKYPDKCPITNEPLFMELEHPELGVVPTYGGPYDSYTIPEIDDDGDFVRHRYDHDEGCWVDGLDNVGSAFEIVADLHAKLMVTEAERDSKALWAETWEKAYDTAIQERDEARIKLNQVADQWKESQHKIKLLNMALRAANNGNDTDDLRYAYEPGKGIEQLKTVCNGVIVHIPVDWLTEIVGELTARTNNIQAQAGVLREALVEEKNRLTTECLDCAYERAKNSKPGDVNVCGCGKTERIKAINQALSTTPAEDRGTVKGLVEALELARDDLQTWVVNKHAHYEGGCSCDTCVKTIPSIANAIAKYWGGKLHD